MSEPSGEIGPPDLATVDAIAVLAREMRANSERWFPRWHSPDLGMPLTVAYALGLAGEVGEVANLVKKWMRDGQVPEGTESLDAELADCLTYLLLLADEEGIDIVQAYRRKAAVNEARWGAQKERCQKCDGSGCEEGCGLRGGCKYAYAGPESHRICNTCHGTGWTVQADQSGSTPPP